MLCRPHYPENVGAVARAIKTMGFASLVLVKPGRLAVPSHEMAHKMAVKSWDVLEQAVQYPDLSQALTGVDWVLGTTSRRGVSGVKLPRTAALEIVHRANQGARIAIVFGNEKSGLDAAEVEKTHGLLRIPMANDQPSINLAQAAQIIAYELFIAALSERARLREQDRSEQDGNP